MRKIKLILIGSFATVSFYAYYVFGLTKIEWFVLTSITNDKNLQAINNEILFPLVEIYNIKPIWWFLWAAPFLASAISLYYFKKSKNVSSFIVFIPFLIFGIGFLFYSVLHLLPELNFAMDKAMDALMEDPL